MPRREFEDRAVGRSNDKFVESSSDRHESTGSGQSNNGALEQKKFQNAAGSAPSAASSDRNQDSQQSGTQVPGDISPLPSGKPSLSSNEKTKEQNL